MCLPTLIVKVKGNGNGNACFFFCLLMIFLTSLIHSSCSSHHRHLPLHTLTRRLSIPDTAHCILWLWLWLWQLQLQSKTTLRPRPPSFIIIYLDLHIQEHEAPPRSTSSSFFCLCRFKGPQAGLQIRQGQGTGLFQWRRTVFHGCWLLQSHQLRWWRYVNYN